MMKVDSAPKAGRRSQGTKDDRWMGTSFSGRAGASREAADMSQRVGHRSRQRNVGVLSRDGISENRWACRRISTKGGCAAFWRIRLGCGSTWAPCERSSQALDTVSGRLAARGDGRLQEETRRCRRLNQGTRGLRQRLRALEPVSKQRMVDTSWAHEHCGSARATWSE